MLSTNANFDASHGVDYKTPMYLVHFDGESVDYCNHKPASASNTLKQYLMSISGGRQTIMPEEGKGSITGVTIKMLDYDDEITALLATDTTSYFHRRKTTIKAGYRGMAEADMLEVFTGWVTGLKVSDKLGVYELLVTDPMKWAQKYIFRDADDDDPITVQGNPINILLAVLTSTGAGTNGDYDWYDEANGLGIDADYINVSELETLRDTFWPGDSNYLKIKVNDKIKGKEFIETEILRVLNAYPKIDGQGRYSVIPFRPPASAATVQSLTEDHIIDYPKIDFNLDKMKNEIEFKYDFDPADDEFDTEDYFADSTSINARGQGSEQITIESRGLHTSLSPSSLSSRAADIISVRKNVAFGRWAIPPIKITVTCLFSRWLSEAGDIVPITHRLLPDIEAGTRGLTATNMEIVNRTVDWKKGRVKIELLNTGFGRGTYGVIGGTGVTIGSTYSIAA